MGGIAVPSVTRQRTVAGGATLDAMDGLVRSVGDGISGLVTGAIAAISTALAGIGDALTSVIPPGLLPIAGVALVVLVVLVLLRR